MWPYIFITFLVIVFAFIDITNFKNNKFLYLFLACVLILFLGLRDSIGSDWWIYEGLYLEKDQYSKIEPGYNLIQILVRWISNYNINAMFFSAALVSVSVKFLAFKKLAPLYFIAVLFYFGSFGVNQDMNMIRQGIAVGFLLFSIPYLVDRKLMKFYVVVTVAACFHVSSLIFILAPLFNLFRKTNLVWIYIIVLASSVFMFINIMDFFGVIITSIIVKIIPIPIAQEKLTFYITSKYAVANGFYFGSLFLLYYTVLFGYYRKVVNTEFYDVVYINFIIGGIVLNFFFNSFEVLGRLTFHFQMLGAILYSYVIKYEKRILFRAIYISILAFIMMSKVINYIHGDIRIESFIPYKTVLTQW